MANSHLYHDDNIPSAWAKIWANYKARPSAYIGLAALVLMLLLSLMGPWIAPFSPFEAASNQVLMPPAWQKGGDLHFFLGTDSLGRDIWSRLLYGAHLTFGYAALIVLITLVLGGLIGTYSGMASGWRSSLWGHLPDALLSLPSVLLALLVVAIWGPGFNHVFWAVILALLPGVVRTIHNAITEERTKQYVIAAKLDGANRYQLLRYTILPNIIDTLILRTGLTFSAAILDISALGFLGLGAQDGSPEWGAMVRDGIDYVLSSPWTVSMPGLAILLAVLATNLVSDGLRQAIAEEQS